MRNPLTLEALADWLARQDPTTEYDYGNGSACLLHKYFKAVGLPVERVTAIVWYDTNRGVHRLPDGFDQIAIGHTIGRALIRANELLRA